MRSIGKKNVVIVEKTTKEVINSGLYSSYQVETVVVQKLPVEMWDTWEMADQEIRRIISDVIIKNNLKR